MKTKKRINKKAQVAIFIILAIAIVIILVLLFIGKDNLTVFFAGDSPVNQIKKCVEEPAGLILSNISMQGGSLTSENYYLYQDNKVDYLCYTEKYYENCIMQKPLLKQDIEQEIENYIKPKAENCIQSVSSSLRQKGYEVSLKKPDIFVELVPNNILISLNNIDLNIVKDKTESYKSIKTDLPSDLYELIMIASLIANDEARYGDSETMNYMLTNPNVKVEKKIQSDGTSIYILTNRNSQNKFMFACRSGVIPAGITGE